MGFFSKAKDQMQQAAGAMSSPAGTMSDANTLNAAGAEMRRLWDVGLPGSAVIRDARPNAAHLALAELERRGKLELLITQNIDGLHEAAGSSPRAPSSCTAPRTRSTA